MSKFNAIAFPIFLLLATLSGCERSDIKTSIDTKNSISKAETSISEMEKKQLMQIFNAKFNHLQWRPIWMDNHLFAAPIEYMLLEIIAFQWPSKIPTASQQTNDIYKNRYSSSGLPAIALDQVEIYPFKLHPSLDASMDPTRVNIIRETEKKGNVLERQLIRPNLERLRIRRLHRVPNVEPTPDEIIYYVPTEVKGPTGERPALRCTEGREENAAGSLFQWKYDIWLVIELRAKYCSDWPEVFVETLRVLDKLVEVK